MIQLKTVVATQGPCALSNVPECGTTLLADCDEDSFGRPASRAGYWESGGPRIWSRPTIRRWVPR